MYKYAHILHEKVHEIIEHHAAPDIIQEEYFSPELLLIDITDDPRPIETGWIYVDGQIIEPMPEPEPTIVELCAEAWTKIKDLRDSKERQPLPYMTKLLDFDSISSERLTWAINAARTALTLGIPFVVDWTCYDNSVLTMTAQDVIGIPLAVAQRSDSLHQKAREYRLLIDAAQTEEALNTLVEAYRAWANT